MRQQKKEDAHFSAGFKQSEDSNKPEAVTSWVVEEHVLGLAEMELIFPIAALVVLYW